MGFLKEICIWNNVSNCRFFEVYVIKDMVLLSLLLCTGIFCFHGYPYISIISTILFPKPLLVLIFDATFSLFLQSILNLFFSLKICQIATWMKS